MSRHIPAAIPCCLAACLAIFAADQVLAQYQRAWTASGWLNRRDYGSDITLDAMGNAYVGGETNDIYGAPATTSYSGAVAAKFNADGDRLWLSNAYSARSLDHVGDVAVDPSGNVFISGETYRYAAGAESFLVKFSNGGTRLWERHLGTPDNEFGMSLAADALGNVFVGGSTTGDLVGAGKHGYDPFIAKYDPNGTLVWLKQYADPALNEYPQSMSLSPGHGIYLGFGGTVDGGLARLDEAGSLQWFIKPNYSSAPSLHTDIYGITTDPDGNVFATGISNFAYTNGYPFTGEKAVVAKHGLDGALLWSKFIPSVAESYAGDVALDKQGNIYICGGIDRLVNGASAGDSDAFWAKFSPSGDLLWFEQWGTEFSEAASGLAIDNAGRVFVVANQSLNLNNYYAADGNVSVIRFDLVPEPAGIFLVATLVIACATTRNKTWPRTILYSTSP